MLTQRIGSEIRSCNPTIGIKLFSSSRPLLAAGLRDIHTIHNTLSPRDLIAEVQKITEGIGVNAVVDTTANMGVLQTCIRLYYYYATVRCD